MSVLCSYETMREWISMSEKSGCEMGDKPEKNRRDLRCAACSGSSGYYARLSYESKEVHKKSWP